jgi:hypothetical protein
MIQIICLSISLVSLVVNVYFLIKIRRDVKLLNEIMESKNA